MIQIDHVTKRFGRATAVDDVTLDIPRGGSVALWGANGAGKTTLIRCVLGLHRFRGTLRIGGHDVRSRGKQARMLIGYVPQELGFYDDLRVDDAVRFLARLKGVPVGSPDGVLDSVGLIGHGGKRIRDLSGGMKQRLALAIALLGDPPVLVLDEVTASLDACGREEFVTLLARLSGAGRTVLFASHRLEEVGALAGRVVVLERGKVTEDIPTAAFVDRISGASVLHLTVQLASREPAMAALRRRGFSPRLNGVGLLVPVTSERKADPFLVLAEARIPVDDFELLGAGRPSAPNNTEARA